ncbi:MAG: TonB-dependent receptor [Steroidobacteraceae bacterium]
MKNNGGTVVGTLTVVVVAASLCMPGAVMAAPLRFDIPAGPASQTLRRFAEQAALPLAVPYETADGRRTRAVLGKLEPDAALQRMLQGTGLQFLRDANGQIVITAQATPAARASPPVARTQAGPESDRDELEELQVTGSRIEALGMTTPTPVTAVSREELEALSTGTLAEALVELPLFLNSDTPQSQSFGASAAAGASHLNLRGIGSIRTLTLLDGRRIVPATRFGTVDYALLPKALLRGVEVVTGGASAAYGSDAVSGVVNLHLDSAFNGLRVRAQGGMSERGDYGNGEVSLAFGTRMGEHSHLTVSAELYRAEGIRGYRSRDWFQSWASVGNPTGVGPLIVTVPDVRSVTYTYGGLITAGPLAGTQFLPGGQPAPFVRGSYYNGVTQSGGDGVDPAADLIWVIPDQRRANAFAKFTTEFTPGLTAFAQVLGGHSENRFDKDPPALFGAWEATIHADNAFLPDALRQQMRNLNLDSFRLNRMGNGELGNGHVRNEGNLLSVTAGAARDFGNWQLDGYYQYGENNNRLRYSDTLRIDRIYRGIDSVIDPASGAIVCRSSLSFPGDGCVPVNILGEGSVSPQARAWITDGRYTQAQQVSEQVAELTLQGIAPGLRAGPLKLAMGVNWRREAVVNTPHFDPDELEGVTVRAAQLDGYRGLPAAYVNAPDVFERVVVNRVAGAYAVWELFGEVAAPLLTDLPLARALTAHGALRYARYSGSGTVAAWKGGLDWQLNPALRLRATRSRDVRAGSLSERFDISGSGTTVYDAGAPRPGFYAITSTRTGNPEVDPELATTWTGGLVLTPAQVQGLSLSADYYDIRIDDAISQLGAQNIMNRCQAGQQAYCGQIIRNGSTGLITAVLNPVLNITEARSRGIDLEVALRRPVQLFGGGESMALRLFANRMLESSTTGISGIKVDRTNQTGATGGAPLWQANMSLAYWRGPLQLTLQQRVISPGRYSAAYTPTLIDEFKLPIRAYTNLRASWKLRQLPGLTAYAQVSNLLDRDPPRAGLWGFGGTMPTNETLFDVLGRRYVAGFTWAR